MEETKTGKKHFGRAEWWKTEEYTGKHSVPVYNFRIVGENGDGVVNIQAQETLTADTDEPIKKLHVFGNRETAEGYREAIVWELLGTDESITVPALEMLLNRDSNAEVINLTKQAVAMIRVSGVKIIITDTIDRVVHGDKAFVEKNGTIDKKKRKDTHGKKHNITSIEILECIQLACDVPFGRRQGGKVENCINHDGLHRPKGAKSKVLKTMKVATNKVTWQGKQVMPGNFIRVDIPPGAWPEKQPEPPQHSLTPEGENPWVPKPKKGRHEQRLTALEKKAEKPEPKLALVNSVDTKNELRTRIIRECESNGFLIESAALTLVMESQHEPFELLRWLFKQLPRTVGTVIPMHVKEGIIALDGSSRERRTIAKPRKQPKQTEKEARIDTIFADYPSTFFKEADDKDPVAIGGAMPGVGDEQEAVAKARKGWQWPWKR